MFPPVAYETLPRSADPSVGTYLELRSVNDPNQGTSLLCNVEFSELNTGGAEPKNIVTGQLKGQDEIVSLVQRRGHFYPSTWRAMRQEGLPVVPELWTSSVGTILMPNLRADGSEMYGKGFATMLMVKHLAQFALGSPRNEAFLELFESESGRTAVAEQAQRYQAQATNTEIALPHDDAFELLLHPDDSWELTIVDLSLAKDSLESFCGQRAPLLPPSKRRWRQAAKEDLASANAKCTTDFIDHLAQIAVRLQATA